MGIFAGMYYWFPKVGRLFERDAGQDTLLAVFCRLQRDILADALARNARHAARGGDVRSAVHLLEPLRIVFVVSHDHRDPDLLRQRAVRFQRQAFRCQPMGRTHARVADSISAPTTTTSNTSRWYTAFPTISRSHCRIRGSTKSSPIRRRQSRPKCINRHCLRALTAAKRAKSPRTTEFLSVNGESNLAE